MTPTEGPDQTLEEIIEHDSNPDTDTDTHNHRYDEEGNVPPPAEV